MSDTSQYADVIAAVSAIAAVASMGIAVLSRKDAQKSADTALTSASAAEKSADAAERSAREAEKSRKVAQANLLAPHFQAVDYLLNGVIGPNGTKIERELESKELVSALFPLINNEELHHLLKRIVELFDAHAQGMFVAMMGDHAKETELVDIRKEANEIKQSINNLKQLYLSIG